MLNETFAIYLFSCRESEGTFVFGNYWREVDDLHAVNQHFLQGNRPVIAIIGHSKGLLHIDVIPNLHM
jgi:hypothetical protein